MFRVLIIAAALAAAAFAGAGLVYREGYRAGTAAVELKIALADKDALIEYVKEQKRIADAYEPLLAGLMRSDDRDDGPVAPVLRRALDGLPDAPPKPGRKPNPR